MKVVVYGASVTAQKGDSGYFENLKSKDIPNVELLRVPFGASHLQFAGIAMLQKVIDEKPDVCILDWVTPSTKQFPDGLVERINNILLSNSIKPIWILFPRTDDPYCKRECCNQIRISQSNEIEVVSFQESIYKQEDLAKILRDVVHTNTLGAEKYAAFVADLITHLNERSIDFRKDGQSVLSAPKVIRSSGIINRNCKLHLDIEVTDNSNILLYIFSKIGPKSPVLKLLLRDGDFNTVVNFRNVVDPWCYYERDMLLNMPSFKNVKHGIYQLEISLADENPFDTVETLKTRPMESIDIENLDRHLEIKELSIDGNVNIRNISYGI